MKRDPPPPSKKTKYNSGFCVKAASVKHVVCEKTSEPVSGNFLLGLQLMHWFISLISPQ